MFIHGGGWSMGSTSSIEWFAKLLASNGYIVANVDYALAPEYPYPASTFQVASILDYIYEHTNNYHINHNQIFIGGNSAGAHLASQLGVLATDETFAHQVGLTIQTPRQAIKGLLLFNGVYDFDTVGQLRFPFFDKLAWAYTGQRNYLTYSRFDELSTIKQSTKYYPATFITVGDADLLQLQTIDLIHKLETERMHYTSLLWTTIHAGLKHDHIYEQQTAEAQKALRMTLQFLNEHSNQ